MKRILLLILLLIPITIKAETITYELCKSGCEYNDINDIYNNVRTLDTSKVYDIIIDIKDGETYEATHTYSLYFASASEAEKSTITYKGPSNDNRPTLVRTSPATYSLENIHARTLYMENINFESTNSISIHLSYSPTLDDLEKTITIKNCDFNGAGVSFAGKNTTIENVNINGESFALTGPENSFNIKNAKIKTTLDSAYSQIGVSLDGTVNAENIEIEVKRRLEVNNLTLVNSTIKGELWTNGKQNYKNTKIEGYTKMELSTINFDNVEFTNGLNIYKDYCRNITPEEDYVINIKNSKIYSNDGHGINISTRDKYKMNIDNTDLSNNSCSIVASVPVLGPCSGSTKGNKKVIPIFLSNSVEEASINVSNSKVNCAATSSNDTSINAVSMFFKYNNKWSDPIIRTNIVDEFEPINKHGNVIELNNGNIFVEAGAEDTLILNVDLEKDIADYFKEILPEGSVLGDWFIEDPSILKVVDGKIIPLKVGTTAISSVIDNNVYSVYITVTEDMVNPNTGANLANVIILIAVLSLVAVLLHKKPKRT